MITRERFESYWKDEFAFEMKRGEGRNSYGLKMVDGEYVSDRVRFAFKIWVAAQLESAKRHTDDLIKVAKAYEQA